MSSFGKLLATGAAVVLPSGVIQGHANFLRYRGQEDISVTLSGGSFIGSFSAETKIADIMAALNKAQWDAKEVPYIKLIDEDKVVFSTGRDHAGDSRFSRG